MSTKANVAEGLRLLLARRGFSPLLVSPTGATAPSCGVVRVWSGTAERGEEKRFLCRVVINNAGGI